MPLPASIRPLSRNHAPYSPSRLLGIAIAPRHQVDMDVEDGLPGRVTSVYANVPAGNGRVFRRKRLSLLVQESLDGVSLCLVEIKIISYMPLRDHEGVPLRHWEAVPHGKSQFVLRNNATINNIRPAKDAIRISVRVTVVYCMAAIAADAQEAVLEAAALEVILELPVNVHRQGRALGRQMRLVARKCEPRTRYPETSAATWYLPRRTATPSPPDPMPARRSRALDCSRRNANHARESAGRGCARR